MAKKSIKIRSDEHVMRLSDKMEDAIAPLCEGYLYGEVIVSLALTCNSMLEYLSEKMGLEDEAKHSVVGMFDDSIKKALKL